MGVRGVVTESFYRSFSIRYQSRKKVNKISKNIRWLAI